MGATAHLFQRNKPTLAMAVKIPIHRAMVAEVPISGMSTNVAAKLPRIAAFIADNAFVTAHLNKIIGGLSLSISFFVAYLFYKKVCSFLDKQSIIAKVNADLFSI